MWSIVLLNEREVVAVRIVGVFLLVDLRKPNLCVGGGHISMRPQLVR